MSANVPGVSRPEKSFSDNVKAVITAIKGTPYWIASLGSTGLVPTAQLGTGTANSGVYLRGDGTWGLSTSGAMSLLGSATIDMKTAATTTIYTTPAATVTRITHIVVRDATASLAGGTSYTVTGFLSAFSLATLVTANTGFVTVSNAAATAPTQCLEVAASTAVQFTVTTGSTAAATATVDVFGYTT